MIEDLQRVATEAARAALSSWSPNDADTGDRLARAIGEAVAAGIQHHANTTARHTALAMAGLDDEADPTLHWEV